MSKKITIDLGDNEMIRFWLINLLESEISDNDIDISNQKLWLLGSETKEQELCHIYNIANCCEYRDILTKALNELKGESK